MGKKTLYTTIIPPIAGLLIITYFITIAISIIPVFADNLLLTIIFSTIMFICLFISVTYILYKSINHPLDAVVNYLEKSTMTNLGNELKMDEATVEYNQMLEKINKMIIILRANIDKRIKSSMDLEKSHEELKKAYQDLKELDRLKSDFIANISHELRTPLISVEGYVEYINSGKLGKLNEKQQKGMGSTIVGVKRLKNLINQLLLYSRLDAKQEVLDTEDVDMVELSAKVIKEYKAQTNEKHIKIGLFAMKNLPKAKTDSEKIKAVLSNLVDNAVKFTDKGEVKIMLETDKSGIKVSIKDTGCGISKEYQKKLFDKFSQLDTSTSRKYGGVGLGLAVVKGVLDLQKIAINVESEEKKGSTFSFILPTK